LNYKITVKNDKSEIDKGSKATKELHILKNCTGVALPGQSLYIMGSSGAGKTSLLNALSDRIK
jgi:ABC-type multidrug transport system ATPase subunit